MAAAISVDTPLLLIVSFCNRIISKNGPVNWSLCLCDLNPSDYLLRKIVTSSNPWFTLANHGTIQQLEDNNRRVIAEIQPDLKRRIYVWKKYLKIAREPRRQYVESYFRIGIKYH